MVRKTWIVTFVSLLLITSCATQTVNLSDYQGTGEFTTQMFKNLTFDKVGRPVFSNALEKRPTKLGEQFFLVDFVANKPIRTFQIAIVDNETATLKAPLAIIFEWTGTGIAVGLQTVMDLEPSSRTVGEGLLVIMTVPLITTVGGLAAGIVASIPEMATQMNRVWFSRKEVLVSYTTYDYDEAGRLIQMKTQSPSPDGEEVSVTTVFSYETEGETPIKTEVISVPENKTRRIVDSGL